VLVVKAQSLENEKVEVDLVQVRTEGI